MDADYVCGKCDDVLNNEDKVVSCFTCKQFFHTHCQGLSDAKYEILSNQSDSTAIAWFCRTCQITTRGMFQHIANLEVRLKTIEAERQKEKHEITVLQNLVNALNKKIKSLEESLVGVQEIAESNGEQIDTVKDAVTCMLNEIPQTTSIEARFSSIEHSLKQVSSTCISSIESRSSGFENVPTIEVANELDDRERRKGNLILHNVPENASHGTDEEVVKTILKFVLDNEVPTPLEDNEGIRIYRLGRKIPGMNRSIKCHLKSENLCEQLLLQSRKLTKSQEFCQVVLQPDLTFHQRIHIKQLVREKKRRNNLALEKNEEADWIIRDGKLYRKRDIYI